MPTVETGATAPRHRYEITLTREDGTAENAFPLVTVSEAEALQKVNALSLNYGVELRDRGRLVIALPLRKR